MRFKKGSKVEVLNEKEVPTGSWLCAEIISGNGHTYSVRYSGIPMTSEALMERVPRKAMRPCPPPVEGVDNWVPGDLVEVLIQNMAWKTGTVVKAIDDSNFLVRLHGKSQEFRAHRFHLRVRQCWEDDKWFVVGMGFAHCKMSKKKNQIDTNTKLRVGEDCSQAEKNTRTQKPHISSRTLNRASPVGSCDSEANNEAVMKVRAIEKHRRPKRIFAELRSPLGEKGISFTHISNASSCGSCSVNGKIPYRRPFSSVKHENEDTAESFCGDAESFCGVGYEEEGRRLSKNKEFVVQDHSLELHSYHSAIKPFFASGLLSWEGEMELTDLRHALHISNDEHLVELRKLSCC